ncbi:PE-PGRS family protein [Biomphalaria glabrata]|uniref:Uncharacterized protein LOC106054171 n=1 Tax=Biomphalaria glabrata TaxID=6526 RepID=A0A9U8DX94_BIOGL|nr:uncharacterized protein LOC106054171 [Biomphalaria glabrata]KAI8727776.1 CAunnamed protein product [Biomphalaria glabrata]
MSFNRSLFLTALAFFVSSQGVQFGQRVKKCQISDAAIFEASGLATSKTFANVAYTLNDRAGKNEIFAVDVNTCQTLAVYTVNSATNWDWEDLAYGPCLDDCQNGTVCSDVSAPRRYCLYIADIGDRGGNVPVNNIYVIREPATVQNSSVDLAGVLKFNWTAPDAETLLISPDARLFVVSKVTGGKATVAQVPLTAWNPTSRVDLDLSQSGTLKISTPSRDPLGGALSPDGKFLLIVAEYNIYFYSIVNGDVIKTLNDQVPTEVNTYVRTPSTQSIAWAQDQKSFFILPEGADPSLYAYPIDTASSGIVVG